jgi:hypothetical protein
MLYALKLVKTIFSFPSYVCPVTIGSKHTGACPRQHSQQLL